MFELATIKDILVNESTAHSLLCYVACIFRSQMERLTLVSKFTSVTIAMLRIPTRLRGMESTHCLLLMQGGGHLLAQPNQITSPDRELSTIRRELRLFTEEFKRSRRSIDSKAELETEAAKLAARETDFRQKCLNLAERNPGKSKGPSIYA